MKFKAKPFMGENRVFNTREEAEDYLEGELEQMYLRCFEDGHSSDDLQFVTEDFWRRSDILEE